MKDLTLLKEFIVEAKQNSYAGKSKQIASSKPDSKDYTFKKYDYYYLDSHIGRQKFIGQEIIWKEEESFWGMNYVGKLLTNDIPHGFNQFLTNALSLVNQDAPYRGPKSFRASDFEYQCSWSGEVDSFKGEEIVSYKGIAIFKLDFHGGTLN